jgi:hypothetical protein
MEDAFSGKYIYFYNIAVYKNVFIVCFMDDVDAAFKTFALSEEKKVDAVKQLHYFITDKTKVLVGYGNRYYDDLILKYIAQNKDVTNNQLYELSRAIKIDEFCSRVSALKYKVKPSCYESVDLYRISKVAGYKTKTLKELAILFKSLNIIDNEFNEDIELEYNQIKELVRGKLNDLLIMRRLFLEDDIQEHIKVRIEMEKEYKIPLLYTDDSELGNRVISHLYCKRTKTPYHQLKDMRTYYDRVNLKYVIPKWITFNTTFMIKKLNHLKNTTISINDYGKPMEKGIRERFMMGDLCVQLSIGGLHSIHQPTIWKSDHDHTIIDADVSSYYPSIMIKERMKPKHMTKDFVSIFTELTRKRIFEKKHGSKAKSNSLKIAIAAVFGKTGCHTSWLYDVSMMLKIALTGELGMLMLIEKLQSNGIKVLSVNTDGLTCYVRREKYNDMMLIFQEWERVFGCELKFVEYDKLILKDSNNYLARTIDSEVIRKGLFNLSKTASIILHALENHFIYGIPIDETIRSGENVFEYLFYFRSKKKFRIVHDGKVQQGLNRWYLSLYGKPIIKVDAKSKRKTTLINGHKAVIANKLDNHDIPSDLYFPFYTEETRRIIRIIEQGHQNVNSQISF